MNPTEAFPFHIYADQGVYTVCLTVTDANGACTATYCEDVVAIDNGGNQKATGVKVNVISESIALGIEEEVNFKI